MTADEAEREAARLNGEHPERESYRWFARQVNSGTWSIVRVPRRPGASVDPLTATAEAKPTPPEPDDPRPSYWRDTGGPWVG